MTALIVWSIVAVAILALMLLAATMGRIDLWLLTLGAILAASGTYLGMYTGDDY